jgi:NTP pyrophosphatase (non-canonical NTP hydrolase)
MSREIHKKLSKKYFDLIINGQKTFELRVADFDCEPSDTLVLDEYEYENDGDTVASKPTGRTLRKKVGVVVKTRDAAWLKRPDVASDAKKYGFQAISLLDDDSHLTTAEKDEILQKFIDTWGVDAEKRMAIEEMAELTRELCKSWRNQTNENPEIMAKNEQNIRDEIADVLITVGQMRRVYGAAEIDEIMDYKLRRGKRRVEEYLKKKKEAIDDN